MRKYNKLRGKLDFMPRLVDKVKAGIRVTSAILVLDGGRTFSLGPGYMYFGKKGRGKWHR